jgi:hypothetical protein
VRKRELERYQFMQELPCAFQLLIIFDEVKLLQELY